MRARWRFIGAASGNWNNLLELELLGYRRSASIAQPGSYQQEGEQVRLHTRSFQLWDEALAARQVAIHQR